MYNIFYLKFKIVTDISVFGQWHPSFVLLAQTQIRFIYFNNLRNKKNNFHFLFHFGEKQSGVADLASRCCYTKKMYNLHAGVYTSFIRTELT